MRKSALKTFILIGIMTFVVVGIVPASPKPAAETPIKIGLFYPQTGSLAVYGPWTKDGFDLGMIYATENTNQTSDGRPYEIYYYDTATDPSTIASKVTSAIENDGIDIIVGGTYSAVAAAIEPIAKENQLLYFITPGAASSLTEDPSFNEYTFRLARNSWQDAKTGVKYAYDTVGARNYAFIAPGYSFGYSGVSTMSTEILNRGGVIVDTEYVPVGTTDLTPYMDHLLDVDSSVAGGIDMLMIVWAGDFSPLYRDMTAKNIGQYMNISSGIIDIWSMDYIESTLTPPATYVGTTGLAVYGYKLPNNPVNDWLVQAYKDRGITYASVAGTYQAPDLFTPDAFATAQFIVNVTNSVTDLNVDNMICHLEGLNISTPKGNEYLRPEDHQGLPEMYIATAINDTQVGSPTYNHIIGQLVETLNPNEVAPPIKTTYTGCSTKTSQSAPGFLSPIIVFSLGFLVTLNITIRKKRNK
ncbi:MAG: substrate-binding domain-containing protein [Candidatus Thorarchaeota archaeon]